MSEKMYSYSDDFTELSLGTARPDTDFKNVLYNDSYFTIVNQCMEGKGTHMTANGYAVETLQNDRIIYVRDNDSCRYFSVNYSPVYREYRSYKCISGFGWQKIQSVNDGLKILWRIYVPAGDDPVEIWDMWIEKAGGRRCP